MREKITLLAGEKPIDNAPLVPLSEDEHCIPQHYLEFEHTLASVEQVILDIAYSDRYPIFVAEENGQLFLQIGIIGYDNYRPKAEQKSAKIVYGRKWRIERQLPTSEIIQTAFLALQKAREHEIRELFQVKHKMHLTTPFNNHHDTPLMSQRSQRMLDPRYQVAKTQRKEVVYQWLKNASYDKAEFKLVSLEQHRNGKWIVDLEIVPAETTTLPELKPEVETLIIDQLSSNALYFALMDLFLAKSNRQVEEHFYFKHFNRFSRQHSVAAIGELSFMTRKREAQKINDSFAEKFSASNYETDKTRVPKLSDGPLGKKIRDQLTALNVGEGILPE